MNRNDVFYVGQKAYLPFSKRAYSCEGCTGERPNGSCRIHGEYDDLNIPQHFRVYPCSPRGNDSIHKKSMKAILIS